MRSRSRYVCSGRATPAHGRPRRYRQRADKPEPQALVSAGREAVSIAMAIAQRLPCGSPLNNRGAAKAPDKVTEYMSDWAVMPERSSCLNCTWKSHCARAKSGTFGASMPASGIRSASPVPGREVDTSSVRTGWLPTAVKLLRRAARLWGIEPCPRDRLQRQVGGVGPQPPHSNPLRGGGCRPVGTPSSCRLRWQPGNAGESGPGRHEKVSA